MDEVQTVGAAEEAEEVVGAVEEGEDEVVLEVAEEVAVLGAAGGEEVATVMVEETVTVLVEVAVASGDIVLKCGVMRW